MEDHTVVAGNPAKPIRRVEPNKMRSHNSQRLQMQQERMQDEMAKHADSGFRYYTSEFLLSAALLKDKSRRC